ncbi:diguanylate cyclase [Sulfurifustis variabilis]|uniref:diguanylate cyclase n=1 Tax=Sulfurifustis variabilis TaxID=1675686 RepID=A0A1B4VAI4_9GAMM|nr:diguanylate cyclase [Sulfurifustis variabilis]BAU48694.1 diguanylate cyclase [Sulfurifustis variabilis]
MFQNVSAYRGIAMPGDAAVASKPCVLVVDDSRVIRRAVQKVLADEFLLIEAEDGEAGWKHLLTDERIQVVISDVEMPKLDGYALICRIRAAEQTRMREVPVIIITGADDEQTRQRAFACGATDFVSKPIDGVQLLARARAHARLDQTIRRLEETTRTLEDVTAVDPLTELYSRRYFLQRAEQDLAYARRHREQLSLIRVDIDDFRNIYKSLGDEATDRLLVWLAGILRSTLRTEDTIARIRAAEFAILAPSTGRDAGTALCERLRAAAAERPFVEDPHALAITLSLGLVTAGHDAADGLEELLARAEERLTLAKAAGGNRLSVGHEETVPPPEEAVMEVPDLETALRMLCDGESGKLAPFLPDLLARLIPLLEYGDRQLDLDAGPAIEALRERLGAVK